MKLTKTQFEYYKKFCHEFNELNDRVVFRVKQILNFIFPEVDVENVVCNINWQDQYLIVSGFKLKTTVKLNNLLLTEDKCKIPLNWLYSDFEEELRVYDIKSSIRSKLTEKEINFLQENGINL